MNGTGVISWSPEGVKGSLNDTEDWPVLTDTADKTEIRAFHLS